MILTDYTTAVVNGDTKTIKKIQKQNNKLDRYANFLYNDGKIALNIVESVICEKMYGIPHREIAKRYNISVGSVSNITQGVAVEKDCLVRIETVLGRKFACTADTTMDFIYEVVEFLDDDVYTLQVLHHNIKDESLNLFAPDYQALESVKKLFG